MNQTVKLTISGACVALGVVLPIAFHSSFTEMFLWQISTFQDRRNVV